MAPSLLQPLTMVSLCQKLHQYLQEDCTLYHTFCYSPHQDSMLDHWPLQPHFTQPLSFAVPLALTLPQAVQLVCAIIPRESLAMDHVSHQIPILPIADVLPNVVFISKYKDKHAKRLLCVCFSRIKARYGEHLTCVDLRPSCCSTPPLKAMH